jgi:SAM-dependent methyltransferase
MCEGEQERKAKMLQQQDHVDVDMARQENSSMQESDRGQVSGNAAEVYEEFFVPALFREWAIRVADAADIQPGWRVLDVACGTGILARTIAERLGAKGSVVGLDLNEGMLQVAKRKAPAIEWRQGRAESLPFEAHSFDATVSQFGLMFFEDRRAALQEMARVLKPGGHLAVAVWGLAGEHTRLCRCRCAFAATLWQPGCQCIGRALYARRPAAPAIFIYSSGNAGRQDHAA